MKIIILGAGVVGTTLAENLVSEHIDLTIVDSWNERLQELQNRFDIKVVHGVASYPDVLRNAGADDCDLLIAVTSNDEVNMVACQIAYSIFRIPSRIARIRSHAYTYPDLFSEKNIPVGIGINPEGLVTSQIVQLINHPGALRIWDFIEGHAHLVKTIADADSTWIDQTIGQINQHLREASVIVLYRNDSVILPEADTKLAVGDEVLFMSTEEMTDVVLGELCTPERPYKSITIAGGGHVGERLALSLEQHYTVNLIEQNERRCRHLAEVLNNTTVLHGSATDVDLLYSEGVPDSDVFCATTNNDEVNVMSSLLAKQTGTHKTVVIVNRPEYASMFPAGRYIDIVFSPRQTTISAVLSYVRRADVVCAHATRDNGAEAIEIVARGKKTRSKVIGRTVAELQLPEGVVLCAVARDKHVFFASSPEAQTASIAEGDHLVLFVSDKKKVSELERMFQMHSTDF